LPGSTHAPGTDAQAASDLPPRHSLPAQLGNLIAVKDYSWPPHSAPGSGAVAHGMVQPRNDPFPNNAALQLGHGRNNGKHRLAHRRTSIEGLMVRNEVNPKSAELLQSEYKLLDTAGESVKPPDHHDIE
jgi:hypothetical protein